MCWVKEKWVEFKAQLKRACQRKWEFKQGGVKYINKTHKWKTDRQAKDETRCGTQPRTKAYLPLNTGSGSKSKTISLGWEDRRGLEVRVRFFLKQRAGCCEGAARGRETDTGSLAPEAQVHFLSPTTQNPVSTLRVHLEMIKWITEPVFIYSCLQSIKKMIIMLSFNRLVSFQTLLIFFLCF